MNTLDSMDSRPQPEEVSPWPVTINYAGIGALVSILYTLIGILTGISSPSGGLGAIAINFLITLGIYVIFSVLAIRKHRNEELGGYINFGRAFIIAAVVIFAIGLAGVLFTYLYMTVIDPSYADQLINDFVALYEKLGLNDDQIEEAINASRDSMSPTAILRNGLISSAAFGAILGAIIAASVKKQPK